MKKLLAALAVLAAVLTLALTTPAQANEVSTGGELAGSFYNDTFRPANHFPYVAWTSGAASGATRDSVDIIVKTGNLNPGMCVQAVADWDDDPHSDPRIVRNCDSNSTRRTEVDFVEPLCGVVVCNLHMKRVQYSMYDTTTNTISHRSCRGVMGSGECDGWLPVHQSGSMCAHIWGRSANGVNWETNGGNRRDCSS